VTRYWSQGHFIEEGSLARDATRLAGIPGVLVRGALDLGHPLELFWALARKWPESELVTIDGEGHRGGPATDAAVLRATTRFAKR
jgi:proline iminopeptidase